MSLDNKEYKALVSLLDDEDSEVVRHIEDKIISLGSEIIPYLEEEWENKMDPYAQRRIEDLIHSLQFEQLKNRLSQWKEKQNPDLLEGLWIVATYQYPDLDIDKLRQDVEQLYYDIWVEFKSEANPYDQVRLINSVLFHKLRFRANTKNFHSPNNSMINMVLESHKGNPISLCAVYLLIAQKLKIPVYGVNLPNLFILTYKAPDSDLQFYINAFNRGLIFSKKDIDNYLGHLNLPPKKQYFEPCSHVDIIKRTLRNLYVAYERLSEHSKTDEIQQLLHVLADGYDMEAF